MKKHVRGIYSVVTVLVGGYFINGCYGMSASEPAEGFPSSDDYSFESYSSGRPTAATGMNVPPTTLSLNAGAWSSGVSLPVQSNLMPLPNSIDVDLMTFMINWSGNFSASLVVLQQEISRLPALEQKIENASEQIACLKEEVKKLRAQEPEYKSKAAQRTDRYRLREQIKKYLSEDSSLCRMMKVEKGTTQSKTTINNIDLLVGMCLERTQIIELNSYLSDHPEITVLTEELVKSAVASRKPLTQDYVLSLHSNVGLIGPDNLPPAVLAAVRAAHRTDHDKEFGQPDAKRSKTTPQAFE